MSSTQKSSLAAKFLPFSTNDGSDFWKKRIDKIPIALFSGVFDIVLQDFADRFQDFGNISTTLRLIAFTHLMETESAPLYLQMELVELKNNEQLVKKFKGRVHCF